ncbi:hypothetical protein JY651_39105 [Pyxidicoccus parkwayensis]|uniref:Uncharacterized protein n=1 Tax=Pyxidicoccus parkwayensis TaxID=2813578 RepID=A0ABX7NUT8_9BACT|nr:hypothetical protein [Pyxidicoccus parkwaysis]QSQ21154.1 hypothetical protein JY651_39105 [Pyxidicoccus parkwaysis]
MHAQVVRLEQGDIGPRIALKTPGGIVWVYWRGDPPTKGQFTDVELAVTRVLTWGEELEPVSEVREPTLGVLDGTLEAVDAEGTVTLRVGTAQVILSARGTPPAPGTRVRLRNCEIAAYPAHL